MEDYVAKDAHGNLIDYFDLSSEPDFIAGGKFDLGGKFNEDYRINAADNIPHFHRDIRKLFLNETGTKYSDYFIAFCFGAIPYDMVIYPSGGYSGTLGQAQEIGVKNIVLFNPRNDTTLNHEVLHGLGLYHTHATNFNKDIKFSYKKYETTNIMSYANTEHPPNQKISTWHWQWKIMKRNVK